MLKTLNNRLLICKYLVFKNKYAAALLVTEY